MSEPVIGLGELNRKLKKLDDDLAAKALRSAMVAATSKTRKKMAAAAPKGTKGHRTYKGRLVAPGFLSRSVRYGTDLATDRDGIVMSIGVLKEAFYGVIFLDEGTQVKQRRVGGRISGLVKVTYRLPAYHWFKKTYEADAGRIVSEFKRKLADKIAKATR